MYTSPVDAGLTGGWTMLYRDSVAVRIERMRQRDAFSVSRTEIQYNESYADLLNLARSGGPP
jgi:hypothetical protein